MPYSIQFQTWYITAHKQNNMKHIFIQQTCTLMCSHNIISTTRLNRMVWYASNNHYTVIHYCRTVTVMWYHCRLTSC